MCPTCSAGPPAPGDEVAYAYPITSPPTDQETPDWCVCGEAWAEHDEPGEDIMPGDEHYHRKPPDPPVVPAPPKRWFVFDPYDGCEFFATEQQALDCASDFIDGYLDDGWDGSVDVVAGFVTAEATQVHRIERGDDRWDEVTGGRTDIEFWCQYEMHPVAASPTVLVELPREVVERYARNHEDVFHPTDYPLVCAAARDALAEKEADR